MLTHKKAYLAIQCTWDPSGETGTFLFEGENGHRAEDARLISPVFSNSLDLYNWAKENGWKSQPFDRDHPVGVYVKEEEVCVVFGLEAQGHIPTVERLLRDGRDWPFIGRAIGWDGQTAKEYYQRHLERAAKK